MSNDPAAAAAAAAAAAYLQGQNQGNNWTLAQCVVVAIVASRSWMTKFSIESHELWPTGIIGTIIFGVSSAICLWRTSMEFILISQTFEYNEHYVIKIGFYLSLTLNSIFELIYSLSLVLENGYVKYGYTSHILALLAIVVAFSTSIYQWCAILFRSHERKKYIFLLKIFLGVNVISSIISVSFLCTSHSLLSRPFSSLSLPSPPSFDHSSWQSRLCEFSC
jgi:hypothetical protein